MPFNCIGNGLMQLNAILLAWALLLALASYRAAYDPLAHRDSRFATPLTSLIGLSDHARVASLKRLSDATSAMLREADVEYWLDSGSLLGSARDGRIIPWDEDVDIGFMVDVAALDRVKVPRGFAFEVWKSAVHADGGRRDAGIAARLFDRQTGCYVDFIRFIEAQGDPGRLTTVWSYMWSHYKGGCLESRPNGDGRLRPMHPRERFYPLTTCVLAGATHTCPAQTHEVLNCEYGDNATLNVPTWIARHRGPASRALNVLLCGAVLAVVIYCTAAAARRCCKRWGEVLDPSAAAVARYTAVAPSPSDDLTAAL